EPEPDVARRSHDDGLQVLETRVVHGETEPEVAARIGQLELGAGEVYLLVGLRQRVSRFRGDDRPGAVSPFITPDRRRRQVLDGQVEEPFHRRSARSAWDFALRTHQLRRSAPAARGSSPQGYTSRREHNEDRCLEKDRRTKPGRRGRVGGGGTSLKCS